MVTVGVPIVTDSETNERAVGAHIGVRVGYEVDVLVVEGHAGFHSWSLDNGLGGRSNFYGPYIGFGGRLRIPASETFVPYVGAGIHLFWVGSKNRAHRLSPTLPWTLGAEIHLGETRDWMLHVGLTAEVFLPGKDAFVARAWSLEPYAGLGLRF